MISNKSILFLGSSVTYGSASGGYSFVDVLRDKYGVVAFKEAVNGTTLMDIDKSSYISRLLLVDTSSKFDAVICQLSTNDASKNFKLEDIKSAIKTIVTIVKNNFHCPLIFYTGTKYDSSLYKQMVDSLYELQHDYNFLILDLWNDKEMNEISKEDYIKYMSDPIHPTKIGYIEWWTPKFVEFLEKVL